MSRVAPRVIPQDQQGVRALHPIGDKSNQFDEDWLQKLLFADPGLLPIDEIDPSFSKLVPLARELPVSAGAIDLVYATAEGRLCLVETKLWRNPEAHRTVLAQILDYSKDMAAIDFGTFKRKVESAASRNGSPQDLLKIMAQGVGKEFDGILFEEGMRRSLETGNFLLLVVGDRIRQEVVMLSEILTSVPSLEFSLALVEVAFYHLDSKDPWPIVAVPSIVRKTHEETRAVVKIRWEEKRPEIEVTAEEEKQGAASHTDMAAFLGSLPAGYDEVFRPYLERWSASTFTVYWGTVGFSLRYAPNGKEITIVDAYPYYISVFKQEWLPRWGNPIEAYREYRATVDQIPEVQRVNSGGKRYVRYDVITPDQLRLLLQATDVFAQALAKQSVEKGKT